MAGRRRVKARAGPFPRSAGESTVSAGWVPADERCRATGRESNRPRVADAAHNAAHRAPEGNRVTGYLTMEAKADFGVFDLLMIILMAPLHKAWGNPSAAACPESNRQAATVKPLQVVLP